MFAQPCEIHALRAHRVALQVEPHGLQRGPVLSMHMDRPAALGHRMREVDVVDQVRSARHHPQVARRPFDDVVNPGWQGTRGILPYHPHPAHPRSQVASLLVDRPRVARVTSVPVRGVDGEIVVPGQPFLEVVVDQRHQREGSARRRPDRPGGPTQRVVHPACAWSRSGRLDRAFPAGPSLISVERLSVELACLTGPRIANYHPTLSHFLEISARPRRIGSPPVTLQQPLLRSKAMGWKERANRALRLTTGLELRRAYVGPTPQLAAAVARRASEARAKPRGDRLLSAPVFVLSPLRSGSTLLRVLLNSHYQLYAPH